VRWIERQQHDRTARHAPHLQQTRLLVGPVVNGEDRHRGFESIIFERKLIGGRLYHVRCR
jgi:hypothetical protein